MSTPCKRNVAVATANFSKRRDGGVGNLTSPIAKGATGGEGLELEGEALGIRLRLHITAPPPQLKHERMPKRYLDARLKTV